MMNLKDQIVAATDCRTEAVHVPEWGCTVHLRQIDVEARVALYDVLESHPARWTLHVLLHTLCDSDGKLVFRPDEVDVLAGKNAAVVDRLGHQAAKLNRMSGSDVEDAKKTPAGRGPGLGLPPRP